MNAADGKTPQPGGTKSSPVVDIMWRRDGNGRFPHIHPPTEWREDKNIVWKTAVEIGGYSSPVVVGNKVFVTAEMGSLVCLDALEGRILWSKDLFSKDSKDIPPNLSKKLMRGCGGESKQSTPTPTSNGELVFYVNAMGPAPATTCWETRSGYGSWKLPRTRRIFAPRRSFRETGSFCLGAACWPSSAKDGKTLWKATEAKPTYATPLVAEIGGEAVAVTPAGDIVRLADGEILCSGLFASPYTTPLVEGNMLYVIDGKSLAMELPARARKACSRGCCGEPSSTGSSWPRPSTKTA